MDRRDFFKTMLATPVLAPFLLASSPSGKNEIFLIADNPEACLPRLLEKLGAEESLFGQSFFVLEAHPREKAISQALGTAGWNPAPSPHHASLTISFRPLRYPAPPSFTFVRNGRIWDIRTDEYSSLWQNMNKTQSPSSCLTMASLRARQSGRAPGNALHIYHNGRLVEEFSLKKDRIKTFRTSTGNITVRIEGKTAFVPASSCRHKICCAVPPVSSAGDRIVCAPNHFLLEVQGARTIDTIIG